MKKNNDNKGMASKGYLRTRIPGRNVIFSSLIDSGNLSHDDLISEKLAKKLDLETEPWTQSLGTAGPGQLEVIGRVKNLTIVFENCGQRFSVSPLVVKGLTTNLNLGPEFLSSNQALLDFKGERPRLMLGRNKGIKLEGVDLMNLPSTDPSFLKILMRYQENRPTDCSLSKNHVIDNGSSQNLNVMEIPGSIHSIQNQSKPITYYEENGHLTRAMERTWIEPNRLKFVAARWVGMNREGEILFTSLPDNDKLYRHKLIPLTCLLDAQESHVFYVPVINFDTVTRYIDAETVLGNAFEAVTEQNNEVHELTHKKPTKLTVEEGLERVKYLIHELKLNEKKLMKDNPVIMEELIKGFLENFDAVSLGPKDIGSTDLVTCKLHLKPGATPVQSKPIPLNPIMEDHLRKQIQDWLENGTIEPSFSEWSSAIFPVAKKTPAGQPPQYRFVVNYKGINAKLTTPSYPIPQIESNLQRLGGAKIFSALDSVSAYSSVKMEGELSKDLTTFTSVLGTYRYRKMPFGLSIAPSLYQSLVQRALQTIPDSWRYALSYLDDLVVFSPTVEEHLAHLIEVIRLQKRIGNKLNLGKCHLFEEKVNYLGYEISANGIGMIPEYVEKIINWTLPETGKDLASFLGFCGYYQRSLEEYGRLTAKLQELKTKSGSIIDLWTPELIADFEELKRIFKERPIRAFPQYHSEEPFLLDCDWSNINFAATLNQVQNGEERLIGAVAKKCSEAEARYCSYKGEMGAVILGLRKFEHLLRCKKFIIRTDSNSVVTLKKMKAPKGIFSRWQAYLDTFDWEFQHRPGKQSINADALSRMPGLTHEGPDHIDPFEEVEDMVDEVYSVEAVSMPVNVEIPEDRYKTFVESDPVLKRVMLRVASGIEPSKLEMKKMSYREKAYMRLFPLLIIRDGRLYLRETSNTVDRISRSTKERLCPPSGLQEEIFRACHNNILAGHGGREITHQAIGSRFYWPNMRTYITLMISHCVPCLAKLRSMDKVNHPMETKVVGRIGGILYVDCVGPFIKQEYEGQEMEHIVTILDGYSRYMVGGAVPNTSTEAIADIVLKKWIYRFGVPEGIHSDQGRGFTSSLWNKIMKRLGINATVTPPYTPASNRVERHHKPLLDMIRTNISRKEDHWCEKIEPALFAHNIRDNRTTSLSPFLLMHGFAPRLPIDVIYPEIQDKDEADNAEKRLFEDYDTLYEIVTKNQLHYQATLRLNGEKPDLPVGTTVYYWRPTPLTKGQAKRQGIDPKTSPKLLSKYIGPWTITKVISDSLVEIQPSGTWAKKKKKVVCLANKVRKIDPTKDQNFPTNIDLEDISHEFIEDEVQIGVDDYQPTDTELDQHYLDETGIPMEENIEDEIFQCSEWPELLTHNIFHLF